MPPDRINASTELVSHGSLVRSLPDGFDTRRVFALVMSLLTLFGCAAPSASKELQDAPVFVDVGERIPDAILELRYGTSQNFLGRPVRGYEQPRCLLTEPATQALSAVQQRLQPWGLTLLIYDCYRPQRAVDDFVRWSESPTEAGNKANYFPDLEKDRLFAAGYIATRSGHSRGSTVDLTLAITATKEPLPMGSRWDFFGERSHTAYPELGPQARANRLLLKSLMETAGFQNYAQEWWHYTLQQEPYQKRYFDVPLSAEPE